MDLHRSEQIYKYIQTYIYMNTYNISQSMCLLGIHMSLYTNVYMCVWRYIYSSECTQIFISISISIYLTCFCESWTLQVQGIYWVHMIDVEGLQPLPKGSEEVYEVNMFKLPDIQWKVWWDLICSPNNEVFCHATHTLQDHEFGISDQPSVALYLPVQGEPRIIRCD